MGSKGINKLDYSKFFGKYLNGFLVTGVTTHPKFKTQYLLIAICNGCGKSFTSTKYSLETVRKSCGCLTSSLNAKNKRVLPKMASYQNKYKSCEKGAIGRNLGFELSMNDFMYLSGMNCIYCNATPVPYNMYVKIDGTRVKVETFVSQENVDLQWIKINGIDRLDNKVGYTLDNSVPCCFTCNRAKATMSLDKWLDYLSIFSSSIKIEVTNKINSLREGMNR